MQEVRPRVADEHQRAPRIESPASRQGSCATLIEWFWSSFSARSGIVATTSTAINTIETVRRDRQVDTRTVAIRMQSGA